MFELDVQGMPAETPALPVGGALSGLGLGAPVRASSRAFPVRGSIRAGSSKTPPESSGSACEAWGVRAVGDNGQASFPNTEHPSPWSARGR